MFVIFSTTMPLLLSLSQRRAWNVNVLVAIFAEQHRNYREGLSRVTYCPLRETEVVARNRRPTWQCRDSIELVECDAVEPIQRARLEYETHFWELASSMLTQSTADGHEPVDNQLFVEADLASYSQRIGKRGNSFIWSLSSVGYAVEVAATHCTSVTDRQKKEKRKAILKIAMHCTSKGHDGRVRCICYYETRPFLLLAHKRPSPFFYTYAHKNPLVHW